MVMRWCGQHKIQTRYKMQNADCGLATKRRLRRKTVFFFFFLTNSVFSLSRNQNIKMQTSQYRKSRIWEMKEDKYTKSLAIIMSVP